MTTNEKAMAYLKTTVEIYKRAKGQRQRIYFAGHAEGATQALLMAGVITAIQAGEIEDLIDKG